jgi:cell division protein ZapE
MSTVTEIYHQTLAERGYQADPAQLRAVAALQRCQDEWIAYKARRSNAITKMLVRPALPRGVYMYGGVGRGKSFLMDSFFQAVPLQRKTRLHFHEFMREVHRELQELKGIPNPLDELGKRIARRFRLICFDEFHVADVTDAMILHRLLDAMYANRVSIITTSNFHPDELYPNGLHRDRILPAIELLKAKLEVINVDNGTDYRRRTLQHVQLYHTPLGAQADAEMTKAFDGLAEVKDEDPVLRIENREIRARRKAAALRRSALAERLSGAGQPVPHAAAVGRADDAAEAGLGGAALHLAGGCALRPARQADHVGRGARRRPLHRRAAVA